MRVEVCKSEHTTMEPEGQSVCGLVNKFPDWIFRARTECSFHTSR